MAADFASGKHPLKGDEMNAEKYQNEIMNLVSMHASKMESANELMTGEVISYMEKKYSVILPESYKWFQTEFIFGGLSVEILGIVSHRVTGAITNQLEKGMDDHISSGMPHQLFLISDVGEYCYCIDTGRFENNECPVVSWSKHDGDGIIDRYDNFYAFLLDYINNSIDNDFFEL